VLVDGEVIYDCATFTRFDAREAFARIDAAAARVQQAVGADAFSLWPLVD
jgi:hypothetical protein